MQKFTLLTNLPRSVPANTTRHVSAEFSLHLRRVIFRKGYFKLNETDTYKNNISETLLSAWLQLTTVLDNERLVSDLPYNEALICNILYRNHRLNPDNPLTATDLCRRTRMFKSQMNRTLLSMELKHIVKKERSKSDRRNVYITLDTEHSDIYIRQHKKVLDLVDFIIRELGEDKCAELIEIFTHISNTANEIERLTK